MNRGAELATGDRLIFGNSDIIFPYHIYSHLQFAGDVVAGSYPSIPVNKIPLVTKDLSKDNFHLSDPYQTKIGGLGLSKKQKNPTFLTAKILLQEGCMEEIGLVPEKTSMKLGV